MDKIRVVVIDDDRDWIRLLTLNMHALEKDIIIVGSETNSLKGIELINTLQPDIVLLDVNITENRYDGITAAKEISKICTAKIIMLTRLFNEDIIRDSFASGAINFVSKSEIKYLSDIIRTTYKKTSPMEILARDYEKLVQDKKINEFLKALSNTEKEVLALFIKNKSYREIAEALGKSEHTIKNQIHECYKKLKVSSKKELSQKLLDL